MTRKITDMARVVAENPIYGVVVGLDPARAIPEQERVGQFEVVLCDEIPLEVMVDPEVLEREGCTTDDLLRKIGFVLGERIPGDTLFRPAQLPTGWKKVPTEHALWTDLVDAEGHTRGRIFYKAAFYDRRAYMSLYEDQTAPR